MAELKQIGFRICSRSLSSPNYLALLKKNFLSKYTYILRYVHAQAHTFTHTHSLFYTHIHTHTHISEVKRSVVFSNKLYIYKLTHKLPTNLGLRTLGI